LNADTLVVVGPFASNPGVEMYGLDVSLQAGLAPGKAYPVLDDLLKNGLLEARLEDIDSAPGGLPRRRLFKLTSAGASAARLALDEDLTATQRRTSGRKSAKQPSASLA
jgi:PadR family transcriptional regulator, regulatory protein PadR